MVADRKYKDTLNLVTHLAIIMIVRKLKCANTVCNSSKTMRLTTPLSTLSSNICACTGGDLLEVATGVSRRLLTRDNAYITIIVETLHIILYILNNKSEDKGSCHRYLVYFFSQVTLGTWYL